MLNVTGMSAPQLSTLVESLRDDLERAKAAENWVLAQDLRRALTNVSNELKTRRATTKSYSLLERSHHGALMARI